MLAERVCTGAGFLLPDPAGAVGVRPHPDSTTSIIPTIISVPIRRMSASFNSPCTPLIRSFQGDLASVPLMWGTIGLS